MGKSHESRREQIYLQFAQNMKALRENKGLTQQELAELVGAHRTSINRIETGWCVPQYDLACLICDELGVTMDAMRRPIFR